MQVSPGTMLGTYEVLAAAGTGGMGEVYRAKDTRLGREVALKLLPEAVAHDRERLVRFEREARLLAALNHPNIATLHGLEEAGNKRFLVMEFVPGETLAQRIARGRVPIGEALGIFKQIAEALQAAHDKGIVHRDLKPSNIKITPEGKAKVLDFGLAKICGGEDPTSVDISRSPTETRDGSSLGAIVGTAPYMSPEQARGRALDRRTDLWAFGCCLYEALTATPTFRRDNVSDTIAAVLEREPDWRKLPEETPLEVRSLLDRLLRKDPNRRLRDAWDVRVQIEDAEQKAQVSESHSRQGWRWPALWMLGGVVAGALVAALVRNGGRSSTEPAVRAFHIATPLETMRWGYDVPAISPDGARIVYLHHGHLWIRDFDRLDAREIPGTANATTPFWSPDSQFVGYVDDGSWTLRKVPATGGPATTLCRIDPNPERAASWGADGRIVISASHALLETSDRGGRARVLIERDAKSGERSILAPLFLPDGRTLLFVAFKEDGTSEIVALTGKTRRSVYSLPQAMIMALAYSPSGHLLYQLGRPAIAGIWAVPFSTRELSITGKPFLAYTDGIHPSVAADGTLAYRSWTGMARRQLVWLDRQGRTLGTIGQPQEWLQEPVLSPDGTRVAVSAHKDGNFDIWIHDVIRGSVSRVTAESFNDFEPAWSPTGDQIAYASLRSGGSDIYLKAADGSGEAHPVTSDSESNGVPNWSRDGKHIVYFVQNQDAGFDLGYTDIAGEPRASLFLKSSVNENEAVTSPDGRYVAYVSDEPGRHEVYVKLFPRGQGRWQVSVRGGLHPRWSGRGDELFFKEGNDLMAVDVDGRSGLKLGIPRKLFTVGPDIFDSGAPIDPAYDVTADGQRFVMVQSVSDASSSVVVVQNWFRAVSNR